MTRSHNSTRPIAIVVLWTLSTACGRIGYEEIDVPPDPSTAESGTPEVPLESGLADSATIESGLADSAPLDSREGDAVANESGAPSDADSSWIDSRPTEGGRGDAATSDGMPTPIGTSFYLEAESGQLSGGFTIGADPSTSGGRYLQPPVGVTAMTQPGSARALYSVAIPTAATYTIWGRIHSPDAHHNTFWIQVDGGAWYLWRIATGDVWYWNRFHDNINYGTPLTFALNAGPHELLIANADDGVGLDRLYFTPNGDSPPGNTTPCNPPSSIEVGGVCQKSCGAQGGNLCGAVPCMGYPMLPAYDCAVCCTHP